MTKNSKLLKKINPPTYIAIGVAFSYAILALISLFGAFVCNATKDPARIVGMASFITLLLTAAISGYVISKVRGDGGPLLSVLSAAGFVTVRIIISLFLSGTELSEILDCCCYLGTGAIFAMLGQKKFKRKRR